MSKLEFIEGRSISYDRRKLYVAIMRGTPYILSVDRFAPHFVWYSFTHNSIWSFSKHTGKEALDQGMRDGEVYIFTTPQEVIGFLSEHYNIVDEMKPAKRKK